MKREEKRLKMEGDDGGKKEIEERFCECVYPDKANSAGRLVLACATCNNPFRFCTRCEYDYVPCVGVETNRYLQSVFEVDDRDDVIAIANCCRRCGGLTVVEYESTESNLREY